MNETRAVFVFLKVLQIVFCVICIVLHTSGINATEDDSFPNEVLPPGIFVGFTIYNVVGCLNAAFGFNFSIFLEAVVPTVASVLFQMVAFTTMKHLEENPFLNFFECRMQNRFSLITSFLFAFHALIAWDLIFIADSNDQQITFVPNIIFQFAAKRIPWMTSFKFRIRNETLSKIESRIKRTV